MSAPSSTPNEDILRGFLLGTLPADPAAHVQRWLDADPNHAAQLAQIHPSDPLLNAVTDRTPDAGMTPAAVERLIQNVSVCLQRSLAGSGGSPRDDKTTSPGDVPGPQPPAIWPPKQLGSYKVVRELGHGGMGYVFEVEDVTLRRRVAAKVLNPGLAQRPDAAARFLREARTAAAVEHVNVVRILHIGEESGVPYMVMPILKGRSLATLLEQSGPLSAEQSIRICREVLSGLDAAHAKGLVHRDLKPANIWLEEGTGRAIVLDFGLARQSDGADALTASGVLMGTPAYMAPECFDGARASVRSDLFALGAVLYECVTGERAFPGQTISAILKAVIAHHPTPPSVLKPSIPAALSDLIVQLLEKDMARRPGTAAEVAAALGADFSLARAGNAEVTTPSQPVNQNGTMSPAKSGGSTELWIGVEKRPATNRRAIWLAGSVCTVVLLVVSLCLGMRSCESSERDTQTRETAAATPGDANPPIKADPPPPVRFQGEIHVLIEREVDGVVQLVRLNHPSALPMRESDKFRIEGKVDPPAYVYLVWVDPNHDVTPLYPWGPEKGWGSRPEKEQPVSQLRLPPNVGDVYPAPEAKAGVATMVLFACSKPLDVPDETVKGWFEKLPELELPKDGDKLVVWFDNFGQARGPNRMRGAGVVPASDPFARWQGQLQGSLGGKASFQTAVSFARTGRK